MLLPPATLPLADAELHLHPDWLSGAQADALLAHACTALPWSVHRIRMFGRLVDSPRLSAWIGDAGARYRYSGTTFDPAPWTPPLQALRMRLQDELGVAFNSVLANRYRDGRDAMGWHRDDEPELGPAPLIASISLGATRRFLLRRVARPAPGVARDRHALDLDHGSLLVMAGGTQRHWQHALPRTAREVGTRVNLTFRAIAG